MTEIGRFDGIKFEQLEFTTEDDIREFHYIYEISNGELWVGTRSGLLIFDQDRNLIRHLKNKPEDDTSLSHNWVFNIFEDSKNNVWVSTIGGGLNLYKKETDSFKTFRHDPNDSSSLSGDKVYKVVEDHNGMLWAATELNGLNKFDPTTEKFKRFKHNQDNPNDPDSYGDAVMFNYTFDIELDSFGRLWIAHYGLGITQMDLETEQFKTIKHKENSDKHPNSFKFFRLANHGEKGLWIATQDKGIAFVEYSSMNIYHYSHDPDNSSTISGNAIWSLFVDNEENAWIGTSFNGLDLWIPSTNNYINYKHEVNNSKSLINNNVEEIFEDSDGDLWITINSPGIEKLNRKTADFTHFRPNSVAGNSISNSEVGAIAEDENGLLYFGTKSDGIDIYNKNTGQFKYFKYEDALLPAPWVWDMIFDRSGRMWCGTIGGLTLIEDIDTKKGTQIDAPEGTLQEGEKFHVYTLYEDSQGMIWAENQNRNWLKYDPSTLEGTNSEIYGSHILLGNDQIWVNSNNGIIAHNLIDGTSQEFSEADGLPHNTTVHQMIKEKEGMYWLATGNGIWSWDISRKESYQYTIADGLVSNQWKPYILKSEADGKLYFSSNKGISSFDPKDLTRSYFSPPVVINSLKYFSSKDDTNEGHFLKGISNKKEVTFPYHYDIISLEFASLSYSKPGKNQYAYKIEGLSDNWINLGNERTLTLTNLAPKTYTLKVRGSNGDGVWNEEGTSLKLTITPPWWLSWPAYVAYAIMGLFGIWALIRWRTYIHKKKLDEERKVVDRLKQVDKLKDQFLANTSHELRTPLMGIIGLSESLMDGVGGKLSEKANKNLRLISSSGQRLANLVNDILDFSKLKNQDLNLKLKPIDIKETVDVVIAMLEPSFQNKPIEIHNKVDHEIALVKADENRLQQILYNLLGNAIKFTNEGSITVHCVQKEGTVVTSITDTGIGIPEDKLHTVFRSFEQGDGATAREYGGTGLGLSVTKMLVEQHGGEINLESVVDKGTNISFSLPISNEKRGPVTANVDSRESLAVMHESPQDSLEDKEINSLILQQKDAGHLLVVDDEAVNRQVLEDYLSLAGYKVTSAVDGPSAIKLIDDGNHYDVILLDIMMPRMSGYKVAEQIRKSHPPNKLPIIMLTAKTQVNDLVAGFNAGASDYLTKPFTKDELLSRIKTHINLSHIYEATSHFVPDEFIKTVGKKDITDVELGDFAERTVTVLFTDIRGYTNLSEGLTPKDTFRFVQSYVNKMGPIIQANHGFVNQYLGDGIMSIFANASNHALDAAIKMQHAIQQYNVERKLKNRQPIIVGMGMTTGPLIMGIIGDKNRKDPTSISDTVNLASRLEVLTKTYGAQILITKKSLDSIQGNTKYHVRNLGSILVRGKTQPAIIYECFDGDQQQQFELKLKTFDLYNEAIEYYFAEDFERAKIPFQQILSINPEDSVVQYLFENCSLFLIEGLPDNWVKNKENVIY